MSNRSLPKDFKLSELNGNTSKLRTLGRLIGENPNIAKEVQSKGWVLPEQLRWNSNHGGDWFYRSPVFTKTPTFTLQNLDYYFQNLQEYGKNYLIEKG